MLLIQRLVQSRQNFALAREVIAQLVYDKRFLVLVPKVSLHGLASRTKVVVENDGIGHDVVAWKEMSFCCHRAVPKHKGVGLGIMDFDDENTLVEFDFALNLRHDTQRLDIFGQRVAREGESCSPSLTFVIWIGIFIQIVEEILATICGRFAQRQVTRGEPFFLLDEVGIVAHSCGFPNRVDVVGPAEAKHWGFRVFAEPTVEVTQLGFAH